MLRLLFVQAVLLFGFIIGVVAPLPATAAYDPFARVECTGEAAQTAVCRTKQVNPNDPLTGPNGVIVRATNIIALLAGFFAVIFLVLAGIKYITSGGAPDQVSKAKESIIYALVGIVVIVVARSLIGFVLSKI
ncbi:MAG: hypothetical protein JWP13_831 [Candidatus Saccharibacteria bacterium]|nr:hypothetical protein [Candidatus Saccharibacteria bacterium]